MKVKTMKMIVLALCVIAISEVSAGFGDQTQIEKYNERSNHKFKKYKLEVPGNEPITIIETDPSDESPNSWIDVSLNTFKDRDDVDIKNMMTDIIHNHDGKEDRLKCYGPSCQEGFDRNQGPQGDIEELLEKEPIVESTKNYRDVSTDRLQAISALAAKLKNEKYNANRFHQYTQPEEAEEEDDNAKLYSPWNKLKVKQHKHPYDDKDGWITLEPVAWSTSKISKWKPNVKKYKPSWNDNDNRFPNEDDRYPSDEVYSIYQGDNIPKYPQKKPSSIRPAYINNKLHITSGGSNSNWGSDMPTRPTWNKPDNYYNYPSQWNPDDSRRPNKHNCDNEENHSHDDSAFYGGSDSVITDNRPSYFPYEYEALKRPMRRPTQVVYAGSPDVDSERTSRPPHGDGQWVLLSTTKGYRNKKRQRSLSVEDKDNSPFMTSHQAVSLTVLPIDNAHTNMTTSHGGILEVEKSFKTVEQSKIDMDRKNELRPEESVTYSEVVRPEGNRVIRRKVVSNVAPDSSAVLAAVGAGMVPATMAMVVPMMLGKRKRRDTSNFETDQPNFYHNL